MSKHVSGKITQTTTTSGRGFNRRTTVSTSETTDVPSVNINSTRVGRSVGEKIGLGFNLLGLIVGVLLVVSLVRSLLGSDPLTFGGLLDFLASAPSIDMSMTSFYTISELAWSEPFAGIASFINFFITIFNVLIFCFKGLGQVALYLIYFVLFIFGG